MKPEAAIMLVHLYGAEDSAKAAQPMTDKITAYRAMQAAMDSMDNIAGAETKLKMRLGKMTATYAVDSKGNLKKINMVFTASMQMDLPMEDGQALSMSVDYDYDMTMTVNATGKSVKITFPDFSGYQEIYPNQMPPSAA